MEIVTIDLIGSKWEPPHEPLFYQAIGEAITRWQQVETAVCIVFEKFTASSAPRFVAAAFFSPRDFSDKLAMADNAGRQFCSTKPDLFKRWRALRNRAETESQHRNAFAHFSMQRGKTARGRVEFVLVPNSYNPNEPYKKRKKKVYNVDEISAAKSRFMELANELIEFQRTLR